MDTLPNEIIQIIVDFIIPSNIPDQIICKNIKEEIDKIMTISLINKYFKNLANDRLQKFRKVLMLIKKYNVYQDEYEKWELNNYTPILYDAMLTGCTLPYARSSHENFTNEIKDDISDILELMQQSVKCDIGQLRCRTKVTPLMAACINPGVPMEIIKLLLKHGADPDKGAVMNRVRVDLLEDLEENISNDRLIDIKYEFSVMETS